MADDTRQDICIRHIGLNTTPLTLRILLATCGVLFLVACTTLTGGETTVIESKPMNTGDYTYDVRIADGGGDLVILLHGFPETSHMWLPLLGQLADNGYTAIAPDLMGYSPGARPQGTEHYAYPKMAQDILAMADSLGKPAFHLVGHDHGAALGWVMAGLHADRLLSWTALSVPHIDAFAEAMASNPEQQQRSQYMTFFRQVGVAEQTMSDNDFAALRQVWNESSPEQIAEYLRVLSQPGALTGALNWYRGALTEDRDLVGEITVPTLMIWGRQDQAIGRAGVDAPPPLMKGPYRLVELEAGHWLIQEAEEAVLAEVLRHIQAN